MSENVIANLGNTYHAWIRKHPDAATQLAAEIEDLLGDAGVTFDRVTARIKTWESLKAKAKKTTPSGENVYPEPWTDIHDIVGVRVTTFHSTEIPIAVDVLTRSFTLLRSVNKTAQTQIAGDFGYGSHHLILEIPEGTDGLDDLAGTVFEVQIRTVLQHAWQNLNTTSGTNVALKTSTRKSTGPSLSPRVLSNLPTNNSTKSPPSNNREAPEPPMMLSSHQKHSRVFFPC